LHFNKQGRRIPLAETRWAGEIRDPGKNNALSDILKGIQAVKKGKGAAPWPTVRYIHPTVLPFVISACGGTGAMPRKNARFSLTFDENAARAAPLPPDADGSALF